MATLTQCIRKAGKALSKTDADAIRAGRNELKNEGLSAEDAGIESVINRMQDLLAERDGFLGEAGVSPDAFPAQSNLASVKRAGYKMDIEKTEKDTRKARLTAADNEIINAEAERLKLTPAELKSVQDNVRNVRAKYRSQSGWAPIEIQKIVRSKPDKSGNTKVAPQWRAIAYNYEKAPTKDKAAWKQKVADEFEGLVQDIYRRAAKGDKNAQTIVGHAAWYRNVTEVLRREFGAAGDFMSDLLGATSPNTPVSTNWKFSVDILRRFSRGDFDAQLKGMHEHLEQGGTVANMPEELFIRQKNGKLYGMNSRNAMQAMYNSWRDIRPGSAPKARNFALNLIGQSDMATIDVWAARMLRRSALKAGRKDLKRIPPPAEKGVTGKWNAAVDNVTGEYGFGAEVLEMVSKSLAESGFNVPAPDLQAVAWFAEKELWAKNGWTTKEGEGGSFEEQMETLPVSRYTAGWSIQEGSVTPSEAAVSTVQAQVLGQLQGDSSVVSARVAPTLGLYAGDSEMSFDTEWTAEKGKHDPSMVIAEIAKASKDHNQKDVFVSRVLGPNETSENARPGIEIYFKDSQSFNDALPVLDTLTAGGIDGFTLAVDPRAKRDGYIGVRMQYVPEIGMRYNPEMRRNMLTKEGREAAFEVAIDEIMNATNTVMKMDGVAFAEMYQYDTIVLGEEDYDSYIEAATGAANQQEGGDGVLGRSVAEELERAAARYEEDTISVEQDRVQITGNPAGAELDRHVDIYEGAEVRAGTTPAQKAAGQSGVNDLQRWVKANQAGKSSDTGRAKSGTQVLGKRLLSSFQAGRPAQLVGQKIEGPLDAAALAQVYRNPKFETFRVILMKGDVVASEITLSSRAPGSVSIPNYMPEVIRDAMDIYGADGYYLMHNHPSGNSSPSQADINATQVIDYLSPGLLGHVIIDFNEFTTIDGKGKYKTKKADFGARDFNAEADVYHDFLGANMMNEDDVADLAATLQAEDRNVIVGANSDGEVAFLTSLPPNYFEDLVEDPVAQKRAMAELRKMLRESGAGGAVYLVTNDMEYRLPESAGRWVDAIVNPDGEIILGENAMRGEFAAEMLFNREAANPRVSIEQRLEGMPEFITVDGKQVKFENFQTAVDVARKYAKKQGIEYFEPKKYTEVDEGRARRIAAEFDAMEHNPSDPEVKASYDAMIKETLAQYDAILETGIEIRFIKGADPYGNPRNAVLDVINNNRLFVFPTVDGYGSDPTFDTNDNPLLASTKYKTADGDPMLANDVFRVVHDYFGHVKNGNGFRARGEENAWQSHAAMYTPLARRAMTTETRGQNSWVNYGPNAAFNRTASGADTIYADQKVGLLPRWVSEDGRISNTRDSREYARGLEGAVSDGNVTLVHYSRREIDRTDPAAAGTGLDRAARRRWKPAVTYFGIEANENGYRKEPGLGSVRTEFSLPTTQLYPADKNPEGLWVTGDYPQSIKNMQEAGFSGYWADNSSLGKVAVVWDPLSKDMGLSVKQELKLPSFYMKAEKLIREARIPGIEPSNRNPKGGLRSAQWRQFLAARDIKKEEWRQLELNEIFSDRNKRYTRNELMAEIQKRRPKLTFTNKRVSGDGDQVEVSWNSPVTDEIYDLSDEMDYQAALGAAEAVVGTEDNMYQYLKTREFDNAGRRVNAALIEYSVYTPDNYTGEPLVIREFAISGFGRPRFAIRAGEETVGKGIAGANETGVQAKAYYQANRGEVTATEYEGGATFGNHVYRNTALGSPDNYRELLVHVPSEGADEFVKEGHFSEPNVLGFLRMTTRKAIAFIEELQSDWHQRGRQHGYTTEAKDPLERARRRGRKQVREIGNEFRAMAGGAYLEYAGPVNKEQFQALSVDMQINMMGQMTDNARRAFSTFAYTPNYRNESQEEYIARLKKEAKQSRVYDPGAIYAAQILETAPKELTDPIWERLNTVRDIEDDLVRIGRKLRMAPEVGFKDEWISLLANRAVQDAIANNHDTVGWMTSELMQERWSEEYAELYDNLYDKKLPAEIRRITGSMPVKTKVGNDIIWTAKITPQAKARIKAEGSPMLRKDRGPMATPKAQKGMTVEEVKKSLDILPDGIIDDNIHVVATQADLPEHLSQYRSTSYTVRGAFVRSDQGVYIIAENMRNAKEVQATALHEAIGHRGIERVFGPDIRQFMEQVRDARYSDDVITKAYDYVDHHYAGESEMMKAAEVVALISESDPKHNVVQKAIQWVREQLRKMGFRVIFSNDDIIAALAKAKKTRPGQERTGMKDRVSYKVDKEFKPKKTVKGYKLFNYRDGNLYPLFVGDSTPVPVGEWIPAEMGEGYEIIAANGRPYVPAKTGTVVKVTPEQARELYERGFVSKPNVKSIKAVAKRPGWHAGELPFSTHLGKFDNDLPKFPGAGSNVNYRPTFQVWAEVEMPADVDWQTEANNRAGTTKAGLPKVSEAHITDQIPHGGYYKYKTNPNMSGSWMISGELKVTRILPHSEVLAMNEAAGVEDLPRRPQDDVLFRRDRQGAAPSFGLDAETTVDYLVRKFQNKFLPLKRLQQAIKDSGGTITEDNDAYLYEELFHGKAQNDLRLAEENYIEPMVRQMSELGVSQQELDDYLYAMHAAERNAHIAKINDKFPDGGSGMTNREAATILAQLRKGGNLANIEQVAQHVYDMIELQRKAFRDGGLEDDGTIAVWEKKYKHYVPLKGIAEDHKSHPVTGQGFQAKNKSWKRAEGRASLALSPSSYAIVDLSERLVERRKNEVGNAFLRMVQANPNPDYWEVFDEDNPEMVRAYNEAAGKVIDTPANAFSTTEYFMTKVDGKKYYIKLKDPALLKAMKNLGPESMNMVTQFLAGFNRYLSSVNTSYAPEFVVSNFLRDFQTAKLNLQAEGSLAPGHGKTDGKKVRATLKSTLRNIGAINASLNGKQSKTKKGKEIQKWFEEFRATGAQTGYFDMKDLDGQMDELNMMLRTAQNDAVGVGLRSLKKVKDTVENINTAVENGVRLAAYISAREEGLSAKQAASLAKNMTVNFNRRGEVGGLMNALYMFANASVQGTANFVRTMGTFREGEKGLARLNNAQKIAVVLYGAAVTLSLMNRMMSDDDDDGVSFYDKVPDYVKERNIVIMKKGFGLSDDPRDYWKIPLPYGYNIFHVMGTNTERLINTKDSDYSPQKAATNTLLALMGSFSPVGFSDSDQGMLGIAAKNMPTFVKPIVELLMNENFANSPVYKENFPFGVQKPQSSLYKNSTPEGYRKVARFLNDTVGGGSEFRSGDVGGISTDVSPDVMAYLVDYAFGSFGSFTFGKLPDTTMRVFHGQPFDTTRAPFLSKVNGRVSEYDDNDKFYTRKQELEQIIAEAKSPMPPAERKEFMSEFGHMAALKGKLKSTQKQLTLQRKKRNEIYGSDLPPAEKEARLKEIAERQEQIVDQFNSAYDEARAQSK